MTKGQLILEKLKSPAFVLGILGVIKLALQGFGYQIPDQLTNEIANGVAGVVGFIGVFMNHTPVQK